MADTDAETAHVRELGFQSVPDLKGWGHAESHNLSIVTRDATFHNRNLLQE